MSRTKVYPAEFPDGHVSPPGWRRGSRAGWRLIDEPAPEPAPIPNAATRAPMYDVSVTGNGRPLGSWEAHVPGIEFDPLT